MKDAPNRAELARIANAAIAACNERYDASDELSKQLSAAVFHEVFP